MFVRKAALETRQLFLFLTADKFELKRYAFEAKNCCGLRCLKWIYPEYQLATLKI